MNTEKFRLTLPCYTEEYEVIDTLADRLDIPHEEAFKRLIRKGWSTIDLSVLDSPKMPDSSNLTEVLTEDRDGEADELISEVMNDLPFSEN